MIYEVYNSKNQSSIMKYINPKEDSIWDMYNGKEVKKQKEAFFELYSMLKKLNGELITRYTTNKINVKCSINGVIFEGTPNTLKRQLLSNLLKIKESCSKNNDTYIGVCGKDNQGAPLVKIKTFDDGYIYHSIGYRQFCLGREKFIKKMLENNFSILSPYLGDKINIKYSIFNVVFEATPYNILRQVIPNYKKSMFLLKKYGDVVLDVTERLNTNHYRFKIKTYDGAIIEITNTKVDNFLKKRLEFMKLLKENEGIAVTPYFGVEHEITCLIGRAIINSTPTVIKQTINSLKRIKEECVKNNDKFIGVVGKSGNKNMIILITTFDGVTMQISISHYRSFVKARNDFYSLIEKNNHKCLSPYVKTSSYVLIDFGCGHDVHKLIPSDYKNGVGCPQCNESKGEKEVARILQLLGFEYKYQHSFESCKYKKVLRVDFYIEELNLVIEYDGIQHFQPIDAFGGEQGFKNTKKRDSIKNKYCIQNRINLLRIAYWEFNKIEEKINEVLKIKKLSY